MYWKSDFNPLWFKNTLYSNKQFSACFFFHHFQRTASIDSLVDSMAITNQKRSLINTDLEEASERLQVRGHNVLFKVPVSNAVFDYYLTQALNIPLYYFKYVLLYRLLYYYQ